MNSAISTFSLLKIPEVATNNKIWKLAVVSKLSEATIRKSSTK